MKNHAMWRSDLTHMNTGEMKTPHGSMHITASPRRDTLSGCLKIISLTLKHPYSERNICA